MFHTSPKVCVKFNELKILLLLSVCEFITNMMSCISCLYFFWFKVQIIVLFVLVVKKGAFRWSMTFP